MTSNSEAPSSIRAWSPFSLASIASAASTAAPSSASRAHDEPVVVPDDELARLHRHTIERQADPGLGEGLRRVRVRGANPVDQTGSASPASVAVSRDRPRMTSPARPRRCASVPNSSPATARSSPPASTTRTSPGPDSRSAWMTDIRSRLARAVTTRPTRCRPGTTGRRRVGRTRSVGEASTRLVVDRRPKRSSRSWVVMRWSSRHAVGEWCGTGSVRRRARDHATIAHERVRRPRASGG